MAARRDVLGSIVAFEGHNETISTQLRLLPTSPQILILPNIQSYAATNDMDHGFDARLYVKKIHDAVVSRYEAAQKFLEGSTPSSKRLVFMNGGTPGAQAMCINAIMENETDGDFNHAENIFNHLVKEGMAGLENPTRNWRRCNTFDYYDEHDFEEEFEDPITRAMRAADALDRQTASLQPTNELDLTLGTRTRSNSLPLYGYADNFGDAAPFFVFGAKDQEETESVFEESVEDVFVSPRSSMFAVTHYEKSSDALYPGFTNMSPTSPNIPLPKSPSCIGEAYGPMAGAKPMLWPSVLTPRSDGFSIGSTDNVVYGEASLLDMRSSGRRVTLARVKSLDRIYPAAPKYRDLCISFNNAADMVQDGEKDVEDDERPFESRRHSCMVVTSVRDAKSTRLSYIEGPRTIVVRSNRPNVKMSPAPQGKKRTPARSSYVDRGTDADETPEAEAVFKTVLPFSEDLVVHFKDEVPDALLDSVVRSFRAGNYPIVSHSSAGSESDEANVSAPGTPTSQTSDPDCPAQDYHEPQVLARSSYTEEEYDPFAYNMPSPWPQAKAVHQVPSLRAPRPPTPTQTPPPLTSENEEKIHEFKITSHQTPVTIQNSLRSVLKDHFPPETQGYRQFQFPLLPELEGLWRPIFQETEPASSRPGSARSGASRQTNRRMDQILAIGAQRGVKKEYSSAITGQLEKLGNKSSGMSRSGRLDFRYLLANAMQAFTAQPLTSQTHDNPFNNSYLLATLIIPHLETYLTLHSEVKYLLLEYPPEHLATMLALQKLIGVDLMKVAQIVDSTSKDALPFTNLRGTAIHGLGLDTGYSSRLGTSVSSASSSSHDVAISKANFLLTSTATEQEIATFVSTVLKILSEISSFYIPEEPPKKASPRRERAKPTPLQGTFSPFPKVLAGPQSPPMSPAFTARLSAGRPGSPGFSSRAPSIAETVKTSKSVRSKNSRVKSRRKPSTVDSQSVATINYDDNSDSDWDMEDRRIMPILVKKPETRKGNSRKALKFLGLA